MLLSKVLDFRKKASGVTEGRCHADRAGAGGDTHAAHRYTTNLPTTRKGKGTYILKLCIGQGA